jgi:hypothetical protein
VRGIAITTPQRPVYPALVFTKLDAWKDFWQARQLI